MTLLNYLSYPAIKLSFLELLIKEDPPIKDRATTAPPKIPDKDVPKAVSEFFKE